ncbi:MAG: GNAT family N-acetyltransferase [Anaerolineae bacterium]|nr:GNAT family N-acetyltransferase [Anaerolineae bacterium]
MGTKIRTVRVEEFEDFVDFIDRGFGEWKGFFPSIHPHLYQPTPEACSWGYVIEENGKLVAHVGLYPLETVTAGVSLYIGGIGGVTTAPEARGKGYMSQLLYHVIGEMRAQNMPLSWLGGDRQRYGQFGWELAGRVYTLSFSTRALERTGNVTPVDLKPALPGVALTTVARFQDYPLCHTHRPHLEQQIHKMEMRYWIAEDGYIIVKMNNMFEGEIIELVSASGNEMGMIQALLEWTHSDRIVWKLSAWDTERLARLMPYTSFWDAFHNWMYRINDLTQLLLAARTFLAPRAAVLQDFAIAIGIQEHDRVPVTTLAVQNGTLEIAAGQHTDTYIQLSPLEAARLFLGGPATPVHTTLPGGLMALLPIPVYVSEMDSV